MLAGLRYWNYSLDVDVFSFGVADRDRDWVDPVVGARGTAELNEDWSLQWRGDIGGFGVGSDFSFQLLAGLRYAFHESGHLAFGYRHLDVDYDDDGLVYDSAFSGPILGLLWGF